MPEISFLILTYNSGLFIETFLDSLFENVGEEIKNKKFELILVDNSSTDNTVSLIKNNPNYGDLKFFESGENLGYAKGINFAAKKAAGELFVIINPDSKITGGDFYKIIEKFKENDRLAVAGLSIKMPNGTKEKTAGKFFNPITFAFYTLGLEALFPTRFSPQKEMKVDFVSGGFIVFRKKMFEELHGYDGDYFMYVEDMDLCYRARKEGFEVKYLPFAEIEHKGQGSSSREFAVINIYKGLSVFYEKHGSLFMQQYVKNLLTLKAALIIFVSAILGKKEMYSAYTKALRSIK